ncbi:hypothetical protein CC1G_08942 [Coprinopsis cinerea okayama7|uniref:Uncharacterized protein n=1 Tax=Coprinopsis cinerea (strain Okayama-7 / 130 / ATCC MYA-4618 / FGSC 9003) TaxID=240176 RepID=A8P4N8_COPC7|nr:hypothetical protein CC1G_08942 [Coprinopsis cinerea okayama7\|eukprot:XP_001838778.1 hypothetical protein CC1G_08942 [Coprinopsis cinerea okayama7\
MAESLSSECTPLKIQYDSCFNSWFEGYLEPAVSAASNDRSAYARKKADEFEKKCGGVWEEYRSCVQKAVKDRGLDKLLQEAREEHPLTVPPSNTPSGTPT